MIEAFNLSKCPRKQSEQLEQNSVSRISLLPSYFASANRINPALPKHMGNEQTDMKLSEGRVVKETQG